MSKMFSFYIALFTFFSCSSSNVNKDSGQLFLGVSGAKSEMNYFKNHFEIAEIVAIQTNDTSLVPDIKRLIRYKDKIIILSGKTNQIFVVNAKDGKIEKCICKLGSGPGESRTILDIAFDESSEQILVYNDYSKLSFLDMRGRFLSEIKVDGLFEEIAVDNGKVVFYNKLEGYSCYPYMLRIFDVKDKTWKDAGRNDKIDFPIRSQGNQLVKSKRLWFSAPLDFSLFFYEEQQLKSPYKLDIPASELNESLIKKSVSDPQAFFREVMDGNLIYGLNSIRETSDYLVFRSNRNGLFIINKEDNKVYWDKIVEEETLGMDMANYYYPYEGDDDKILFILLPENYVKHHQLTTEHMSMRKIDSLKMKEDDNPILIFYKQKKDLK